VVPALLLVDVQRNMLEPPTPIPGAAHIAATITAALTRARASGDIIVHIRNNGSVEDPDAPNTPGWELVHDVRPGEHVIDKHEPDAFAGTHLTALLPEAAPVTVVGMQSEYCVRETALAALAAGHPVTLLRGGHATYDGDRPAAAIAENVEAELRDAGVLIVSPESLA
jgi:nicotinamidase-related amidase